MTTLNRLLNADDVVIGYFTDDAAGRAAMQAARAEWDEWNHEHAKRCGLDVPKCRSIATPIKPLVLS